eukprot:CAMPEP_0183818386 /NCGR_PEP_ID=MMETSP0803_2-20130417/62177_1 /TAXON_ID=195967 /ORGANISM="Crustomastix stigmata, Strain CCMP3273" /LENGTH=69 /DNA_ID=CAMNT_0026063275 /DNA_START=30 /DNA_END=235 /DNA_ORIENTATION=+
MAAGWIDLDVGRAPSRVLVGALPEAAGVPKGVRWAPDGSVCASAAEGSGVVRLYDLPAECPAEGAPYAR